MSNYLDERSSTTDTIFDRLGQHFRKIVEDLGQATVSYVQMERDKDDERERARRAHLARQRKMLSTPRA